MLAGLVHISSNVIYIYTMPCAVCVCVYSAVADNIYMWHCVKSVAEDTILWQAMCVALLKRKAAWGFNSHALVTTDVPASLRLFSP